MKLSNSNISRAVRKAIPRLTDFKVCRHFSGYFYVVCAVVDGKHDIDVRSEYTYSLEQRSFQEWVTLWSRNAHDAMDEAGLLTTPTKACNCTPACIRMDGHQCGTITKPQPRKLSYRAMREPGMRGMTYLCLGVAYGSLKDLRDTYPHCELVRVKATRNNRIFG